MYRGFLELLTMNKKGQVEITETLLVLLVIVILIGIGLFFYYSFFYQSLSGLSKDKIDSENIILLHTFTSLSEVKCDNEDCVDFVKVMAFKELIKENKDYYFSKFKKRKITIEQIYPAISNSSKVIECTKKEYQQKSFPENCRYIAVYDSLIGKKAAYSSSLPVSLYFPNTEEYRIGLLRIEGIEN